MKYAPIAVAYISFDSNMFGSERSLLDLMNALDRTRVTPRLIIVRPGPLEIAAREFGIEVHLCPWFEGPFRWNLFAAGSAALRLGAWLRRHRIRIVALNRVSFGHLAVMNAAAGFAGSLTVAYARMSGARLNALQKLVLLATDRVVSVSETAIVPWQFGWMPQALARRLRVIPDSREVSKLKTLPRDRALVRSLGVPDGARIVGMVGAVVANKRQDLFLAAAESILREVPDAWFVVVGGGIDDTAPAYGESLRGFLEGKALAGRVVFTGYRDDALPLMKNFDVLLVPSDHEAFGGVLIEAMALGVPIVAHRVDGMPEIIADGTTGVLVGRQEPSGYAAAAVRLLSDREYASALREAALAAVERFESARIARRTVGLYDELLGRRINVACVSFDSNMFGSERSMLDVMTRLDRSRIMSRLILVRPGPLEAVARERGIEVFLLPWLEGPFRLNPLQVSTAVLRLARWLRSHQIHILELNRLSFGHLMVMNLAAALAGAKSIVRVRMTAKELTAFQRLALLTSDMIIPVSAGSIAAWQSPSSPALVRRVRVIHNSRDVLKLRRQERSVPLMRSLGVPENALVVGMVGAIVENKRQDLFLGAAEIVLREIPDAWFVIVGPLLDDSARPYADSLKKRIEGKALAGRVVFTGYRDDALPLMKNFDMLLMPSDREAFGGVLIEALALGVPIIAHRVDGTSEIIDDGKTGILIDRQEPDAYAEAVLRLFRDSSEAARMREAGAKAVDLLDSAVNARTFEGVYRELAQPSARGESA